MKMRAGSYKTCALGFIISTFQIELPNRNAIKFIDLFYGSIGRIMLLQPFENYRATAFLSDISPIILI